MGIIPVRVRELEIGTGMPKICVPIAEVTKQDILTAAQSVRQSCADLVEWRVDWYEDVLSSEKVTDTLENMRKIIGELPLLFTFRTAKEGGEKAIDIKQYTELIERASASGFVDLVDVELFTGDGAVQDIVESAHYLGVKVIVSSHDFEKTPDKEVMLERLCRMQELGADILKLAVMPKSRKDVLTLLEMSEEMACKYAKNPVVTMSMSKLGVISRLCGQISGSAITFGTAGKASAPGQVEAERLKEMLELLHVE